MFKCTNTIVRYLSRIVRRRNVCINVQWSSLKNFNHFNFLSGLFWTLMFLSCVCVCVCVCVCARTRALRLYLFIHKHVSIVSIFDYFCKTFTNTLRIYVNSNLVSYYTLILKKKKKKKKKKKHLMVPSRLGL